MHNIGSGLSYEEQGKTPSGLTDSQTYMKNPLMVSETLVGWEMCRTRKGYAEVLKCSGRAERILLGLKFHLSSLGPGCCYLGILDLPKLHNSMGVVSIGLRKY